MLLVEDDRTLADSLKKYLKLSGIEVDTAYTYEDASQKTLDTRYDVYLVDINLQDGNGIELVEALKLSEDRTPVIFISALTDLGTIAKGFEVGAEDYIKKPFDPDELVIRIKSRVKKNSPKELRYKDLIYKDGRFFKNGKEIELGEVMRNILLILLENKGKVVPKETLYDLMINPSPTALRVLINRLKKKTDIEIKSVRGLGYVVD